MKTLLLALGIALSLSACETGPEGPPPTLSPEVQAYFERYMRELSPSLFVVSTDGQHATYTYCPGQADHCYGLGGATKSKTLRECKQDSGVPCHVYAVGRRIVWKGTAASGQTPEQRLEESGYRAMSADEITVTVAGKTVYVSASNFVGYHAPDGEMRGKQGTEYDQGIWSVTEDNEFCVEWNIWREGKRHCARLFISETDTSKAKRVRANGRVDEGRLEVGNTEGL